MRHLRHRCASSRNDPSKPRVENENIEVYRMKKILIDMLVCPSCLPDENELEERIIHEEAGDIVDGSLTCRRCGGIYPIRDGIAYLEPRPWREERADSKYETSPVLSSYLWSHYGDILGDPEASSAYEEWANLITAGSGVAIDIGGAVGRFAFEMTARTDFVVGIDNSVSFIRSARDIMAHRRMKFALRQEGNLSREKTLVLRDDWHSGKVEFIVGDALALPFPSRSFSTLTSLNLLDKVSLPLKHLREMNRVAKDRCAQLLLSDPFSWSTEAAREEDWLGGKENGVYSGSGMENVCAILKGRDGVLLPEWHPERQGHVWWKIRTHGNHFELIRSCYVKAVR